jgi:hypothetical protein
MRLRFLVPRGGRGAGQRRLRPAAALAAALLVLAGCGGAAKQRSVSTVSLVPPAAPHTPAFAVGITEANPHLLAPGPQPEPFPQWRDRLAALHPSYVRVLVDWSQIQPQAGRPPDWTRPQDGCMRKQLPCAPWNGVLDTLRAIHALGAAPVLVVYGTPDWAAVPATGCERPDTTPYARLPRIADYRAFVRSLLALGRREGIDLPWWSAWNEPNLPAFLNPQRARCEPHSPTLAAAAYTRLVRALRGELAAAGGDRHVLVGETAGIPDPHPYATAAAEFARALPDGVVCGADAWAQHAHLVRPRGAGRQLEGVSPGESQQLLDGVGRALDEHHCSRPVPIWITETGVGGEPDGCALMAARLRAWRRDPRIQAAFQYTFREDPAFPVGLADLGLTTLYPAYEAWLTRGETTCR